MSNYSNDPGLRLLSKQLQTVRWAADLSVDERNIVINTNGKNVAVMPDGITHCVRMYIAGAVHTLGITRNAAAAFRFADLVRARFWKYRQRGCHPPEAGDLNFSLSRLQEDLLCETEVVKLLDNIEAYLSTNYALSESRAVSPRKTRSRVTELAASVSVEISALKSNLEIARQEISALKTGVELIRQAAAQVASQANTIAAENIDLKRRVAALETGVTVFDCGKQKAAPVQDDDRGTSPYPKKAAPEGAAIQSVDGSC